MKNCHVFNLRSSMHCWTKEVWSLCATNYLNIIVNPFPLTFSAILEKNYEIAVYKPTNNWFRSLFTKNLNRRRQYLSTNTSDSFGVPRYPTRTIHFQKTKLCFTDPSMESMRNTLKMFYGNWSSLIANFCKWTSCHPRSIGVVDLPPHVGTYKVRNSTSCHSCSRLTQSLC